MANPSMEQVVAMAGEYNLIPVAIRLLADMETPIRIFQRYAERKRAFLLESVEGGVQWARFSFIGTDPFLMITGKKARSRSKRTGSVPCWKASPSRSLKRCCVRTAVRS